LKIHGMIYKIRRMSGFAFILLRTANDIIQCVYDETYAKFNLDELKDNMAVIFNGEKITDERSKAGYEIRVETCEILSSPADEAPIVINNKQINAAIDTVLDYRPLTLRNNKERAIFKLQEGISRGFRNFFHGNGFTEIHSPKIVYSGAEGGANIFKLDYFGKEAYLAQSPQFYKQIMTGVFERVYEIAPVFRAEKHHTSRHINEYTSVDAEIGFIEDFRDIIDTEIKMLAETFTFLNEHYANELELWNVTIPSVVDIPLIRFDEAKELVSSTYKREITDFEDFEPEEEKLLCEIIKKKYNNDFVFVTHYKSSKRPFYAMDSDDSIYTESYDLLFRGMEITTGGQRIHDYNKQVEKMLSRDMNIDSFASYLMAHKYGLPPHGGFGLGLERFTACLLNLTNVRSATLFPRDTERLEP
jgi:aspartyl-tRNA synthetase, archaeal type